MAQLPYVASQPARFVLDRLDAVQQMISDGILLLERRCHPLPLYPVTSAERAEIDRAIEQRSQLLAILEATERRLLAHCAAWNLAEGPPHQASQQPEGYCE